MSDSEIEYRYYGHYIPGIIPDKGVTYYMTDICIKQTVEQELDRAINKLSKMFTDQKASLEKEIKLLRSDMSSLSKRVNSFLGEEKDFSQKFKPKY